MKGHKKLATIHGRMKTNVVLPLCLPKASLDAYEKDPTDEHRLMYRSNENKRIVACNISKKRRL